MTNLTPERRAENMRLLAESVTSDVRTAHGFKARARYESAACNDLPLYESALAEAEKEIERLKTKLTSYVSGIDSQHEEITRLTANLTAAERCLSNAWVDYDANPYQMATDEYDRQATGTLVVDVTGERHWVQQLGVDGAKAAIGASYDYWREKDRADHLEAKLTTLRDGIAEVVQVEGKTAGEFLLWPLGRMHVNSENEMVGCSPAGAKLAKLWRDSDPQETPKA